MALKLKNSGLIKDLYQRPIKEEEYPHFQIYEPNVLHETDVLYFTSDNGTKYILTVIDVHNRLCDARPIKNMNINTIITALDDIYQKSPYLEYPNCLQGDGQFNNTGMRNYCKEHSINLKITEPYEHRQNAHVERLNQSIGKMLWVIQVDREIETDEPNTTWLKELPLVVEGLNQKHLKGLNEEFKKPYKKIKDFAPKFNPKTKYLIEIGTEVRKLLTEPETLQGKKLQGRRRATDTYWRYKPTYLVKESYLMPNSVPLYEIETSDTHKVFKHLLTNEQLQVIKKT
jgi:hypothetical protein